jgi:copper chaperone CopZ
MCKKRIEKAANQVEGVYSADWNIETKMMKVVLDDSKTDIHKVHMAITKAGHDTEMHAAKDETYAALMGCCQYQRINKKEEKMQMKMHPEHQH